MIKTFNGKQHVLELMEDNKKQRSKTMHSVIIKKVNQGFIITIGCQTFVATDEKKMFNALSEYFADPKEAEKKYCEKDGE